MITAAALCPSPPLLAREVTGRDPVVPELRQACAEAVGRLVRCEPDVIAVVGPAPVTARWPVDRRLDLSGFAPHAVSADMPEPVGAPDAAGAPDAVGAPDAAGAPEAAGAPNAAGAPAPEQPRPPAGHPPLPLPLGLGTRLLDQAGYTGARVLEAVGYDEPTAGCAALGEQIAASGGRVGLLIMADGSARRGPRAPGYLDERAAAFDAAVEDAVRDGDLGALLDIDPALARELLAAGRPAWQVLAGAVPGQPSAGAAHGQPASGAEHDQPSAGAAHGQPASGAVHGQPSAGAAHGQRTSGAVPGQPSAGAAREQLPTAEILYSGDPFGVAYLVAWRPCQGAGQVGRLRASGGVRD
jgi:hypothetical protein